MNPGAREWYVVTVSYKTPAMLLIWSICAGHQYMQANTNKINKTDYKITVMSLEKLSLEDYSGMNDYSVLIHLLLFIR